MKRIFITLILSGKFLIAMAQDIHFSQMIYSPLTLNPAMAGANFDMQAIINYKNQWSSVASPYKTMATSFDMRLNNKKAKKGFMAAGLNVFNDQAGDAKLASSNANLSFAYHIFLNARSTFGGALYGGYGQRSISPGSLTWANQYDGVNYDSSIPTGETFATNKKSYFDAGAGVVYTYKKSERYMTGNDQRAVTAGASVFHVNKPNYSFYDSDKMQMRIAVFATALIGLGNSHLSAMPAIYFNRQGPTQEILVGSYIKKMMKDQSKYTSLVQASAISMGVFYRNRDAVILKLMLEKASYSAGVAYDLNVSTLSDVSKRKGGFEVFIRFTTPSPFAQSKARI